jgi:flagellar hook-length control protein FliK
MTTDRTAAPSRSTALADRPASAGGRTPAPPADMFSALLGAATPKKGDQPVRRDDNPANRRDDDHGHIDKQRRGDDAHRAGDKRKPVHQTDDVPPASDAAETADTATQDANAEQKPTVTIAPNLFALQLTSPLPPQGTPTAETPADAPTLPAFAGQVPASVAAATTAQATLSGTVGAIAATAAEATATATAATTAGDAAAATATAAQGAIALEGLPAEATADTTLPAGIDLTKPQVQAPATDAPAAPAQDAASQPQQNPADAQSQPQPQDTAPAQPAAPAQHTAKPADAPAPSSAPQPINTSPIAPNAAPAMPSTPSVQRAVPLSRAVATTGVMVHMMSSKGVEHARLNLKPAELGGIEVRLRSTDAGLHALLVADSPEAARMLASAGDDLKRQLEDKNVTLLSLDVSTSDQRQDQPAGFSSDGFGDDRYRPGFGQNTRRSSANESALLMDAPASAETTLVLPDGVHVDVLA